MTGPLAQPSITTPVRVVVLIVDGLPHRHVTAEQMPTLWGLATTHAPAPSWGRAVMTSSTYPNHASFATGVSPHVHRVIANHGISHDTSRIVQAPQPHATTIFTAAAAAGLRAEAILGDAPILDATGARDATHYWPPDGVLPPGIATDAFGHADDDASLTEILASLRRGPDLLMARLNQVDTTAHLHGPDSTTAVDAYRRADTHIASIHDALQAQWDATVLIIVSDHDQETATVSEPVDLTDAARTRGVQLDVASEGAAALVRSTETIDLTWLRTIPGIAHATHIQHIATPSGGDVHTALVWTEPGHWIGGEESTFRPGIHGSPRTRTQVAVITGGHPAAAHLAATAAHRPPEATTWTPTIARLLGIPFPHRPTREHTPTTPQRKDT